MIKKLFFAAVLAVVLMSCTDYSYDLMLIDPDMKVLPGVRSDLNRTFSVSAADLSKLFGENETIVVDTVDFSQVGLNLKEWKFDYVHVEEVEIGFRASNPLPVSITAESANKDIYALETTSIEPGTSESPRVTEGIIRLSSQHDLLRLSKMPVVYTLIRNSNFSAEFQAEFSITFTWISFPGGVGVNFLL